MIHLCNTAYNDQVQAKAKARLLLNHPRNRLFFSERLHAVDIVLRRFKNSIRETDQETYLAYLQYLLRNEADLRISSLLH